MDAKNLFRRLSRLIRRESVGETEGGRDEGPPTGAAEAEERVRSTPRTMLRGISAMIQQQKRQKPAPQPPLRPIAAASSPPAVEVTPKTMLRTFSRAVQDEKRRTGVVTAADTSLSSVPSVLESPFRSEAMAENPAFASPERPSVGPAEPRPSTASKRSVRRLVGRPKAAPQRRSALGRMCCALFRSAASMKVSKDVLSGPLEAAGASFLRQLSLDIAAVCAHAGRRKADISDFEVIFRRQRHVTAKRSLADLLHLHLPIDHTNALLRATRPVQSA